MERSALKNLFVAYLNGAMAASVLYWGIEWLLTDKPTSTAEAVLLCYWLIVAILFGMASVSFVLNWPKNRALQYTAVGSLIPIFIFVLVVRLYLRAAA